MSRDERDTNDEVHEVIHIPPAIQTVLDTPPVQRLVNLKQLGCAYNAYPSCTHSRKEHSLGVMELAGKLATSIKHAQPQLGISDLDVLCVRIAGLCHDLGHGPFSHAFEAFLKAVYRSERDHPELYRERNELFRKEYGMDIPELPEEYEHEQTSLMMVDDLLAAIGLEIDWTDLDGPLKQIGDGIDANFFGFISNSNKLTAFTSRDWVFIKECIYGYPLEQPDAPVAQTDFVGRSQAKDFLYDIVNNRHNGLDVDKIDYFSRDSLGALGVPRKFNILIRNARVSWGICPNPQKCFRCNHQTNPEYHMMIVYPKKMITKASEFYQTRIRNHVEIYTHKKTKSAELHTVDLLMEADKLFSMLLSTQHDDPDAFPIHSRFEGFNYPRLPISRAWSECRLICF
jgi:HD superfamily phosphohydrolase